MPFASAKQRAFLFVKKPKVAKEFAAMTPNEKELPERVAMRKKVAIKKRNFVTTQGGKI